MKYNLSTSWPKTKRPNSNKPKDYLNSKYKKLNINPITPINSLQIYQMTIKNYQMTIKNYLMRIKNYLMRIRN